MRATLTNMKLKPNPYNLKPNLGFTLIEAVVSAGVFALAATSIVGVYTSIQRLNSRSTAFEAIEQNIRFISEDLSKLISNGAVNYDPDGYNNFVPQPSADNLYIIDRSGSRIRIYKSGDELIYDKDSGNFSTAYTGREVKVLEFKVFITPDTNPFPPGAGKPKEQPTVTIYAEFEANSGSRDAVRQIFQTTITTKQYPEQI